MTEEWLVDGCNLLHGFRDAGRHSRELSRNDLCGILSEFASSRNIKMMLVFDGIGRDAKFGGYATDHFKAQFSQKMTADTAIERTLYEKKAGLAMVVVTNDRAMASQARGCGARVMGTNAIIELLALARKEGGDTLFRQEARAHGFNRPFEGKI